MSKKSNLVADAAKGAALVGAAGTVFVLGSIGAFLFLIWGAMGAMNALDVGGHIDTFLNHMNGGTRQHIAYRSSSRSSSYGSRSSYVPQNIGSEEGNAAKRFAVEGQNFDFSPTGPSGIYATANAWGPLVQKCLSDMGDIESPQELDAYLHHVAPRTPLTGNMFFAAARKYGIPVELTVAVAQAESSFCGGDQSGLTCRTQNVGNYGNMDDGSSKTFATWEDGIDAMAGKIARSRTDARTRFSDNTRPETASN